MVMIVCRKINMEILCSNPEMHCDEIKYKASYKYMRS
jgi:hypothetical protein